MSENVRIKSVLLSVLFLRTFQILSGCIVLKHCSFSFMPEAIASGSETIFHYKGIITPPKNWSLWYDLIENFAQHLIDR